MVPPVSLTQNKAMVVVMELFKWGKAFLGHLVHHSTVVAVCISKDFHFRSPLTDNFQCSKLLLSQLAHTKYKLSSLAYNYCPVSVLFVIIRPFRFTRAIARDRVSTHANVITRAFYRSH